MINRDTSIESSVSSTDTETEAEVEPQPNSLSSDAFRAKWMVDNNKVNLVPNMKVFNVCNENNQVFNVKLNPDRCSCPERKGCCHIKAVNLSIG